MLPREADRSRLLTEIAARRHVAFLTTRRKPRTSTRLPRQRQPSGAVLSYYAAVRDLLERMREVALAKLLPRLPRVVALAGLVRDAEGEGEEDDYGSAVARSIDEAQEELERDYGRDRLRVIAKNAATKTSDQHRADFARQLKAGLGIDIVRSEPWLESAISAFTVENVRLIKTIPDRFFAEIQQSVIAGVRQGKLHGDLAAELREQVGDRFEVAKSRAQLIARDQTSKFLGDLNRRRQSDLGIDHFIWRTSGDNRVRDSHEALNGKRFTWTEGANGLFPGDDIQCRCTAEPDVKSLLESL